MWRLSRGVSTQRVAGRRFKATSDAEAKLVKRVRDAAIQHITAKGPVPVWSDCEAVLKLATAQLATRANVQSVSKAECPEAKGVQVWGDVHGQGKDFLHIMNALTPLTATAPSLFNGDLVDRGPNGSEIVLLLATYIVECPTSVWINRGNHEVPDCYHRYGFAHEILGKYGAETKAGLTLRSFQDFFNATSMAHVVDNSIFVVHGGPPKDRTTTIATLNAANRFEDDPGHPFHLMLWSDPDETEGQRGAVFSRTDVKRFLDTNKLKFLIRSHEVMQNGYQVHHKGLSATVFSAPAYCGRMTNKAAVAWCEFNGSGVAKFEQFDHAKPGRS